MKPVIRCNAEVGYEVSDRALAVLRVKVRIAWILQAIEIGESGASRTALTASPNRNHHLPRLVSKVLAYAVPGPGKIDRRTVHDADRPMGIVWICRSGVKGRGNWVGFLVAGHDRFPCVSEGAARGGALLPN
jgi:hypothetical protein